MKTGEVGKACGLSVPRPFHLRLVLFEMHGSGVSGEDGRLLPMMRFQSISYKSGRG
jgi:hypothetical protein